MLNNFFFNFVVYEIKWKNIVKPDRAQMVKPRMRFACWIPEAKNTHTQYVIRIILECNIGCVRRRLDVTLHVNCLYFIFDSSVDLRSCFRLKRQKITIL